jgi:putative tricarboxylic transport membrane protein
VLYSFILGFCVIGAYSIDGQMFDVGLMAAFGVLGYLFKKLGVPLAPLILTLILGPLMEQSLRQSLEISRGDFSILLTRPISLTLIVIAALFTIGTTMRIAARVRGPTPKSDPRAQALWIYLVRGGISPNRQIDQAASR